MKFAVALILPLFLASFATAAGAANATPLKASGLYWRTEIGADGTFQKFETSNSLRWRAVPLASGEFSGPAWIVQGNAVPLKLTDAAEIRLEGRVGDLTVWLRVADQSGIPGFLCGIRNEGKTVPPPLRAGIRLGLDFSTEKGRVLPSVFQCEKTHFWGVAASEDGAMLGLVCSSPVAAWHLDRDPKGAARSLSLDFLTLDSAALAPGETREWAVRLAELGEPAGMKRRLAELAAAPIFEMNRCTQEEGNAFPFTVYSSTPVTVSVQPPQGAARELRVLSRKPGEYYGMFRPPTGKGINSYGVYTLTATDAAGHKTEARCSVRRPWDWYLHAGWKAALAKPQRAAADETAWLGLFTEFRAMRYLMDLPMEMDSRTNIADIVQSLWNREMRQALFPNASADHFASLAALFAERHRFAEAKNDLLNASSLLDNKVFTQPLDYSRGWAVFDVLDEERRAGATEEQWKTPYDRHLAALRRAMDEQAAKKPQDVEDPAGASAMLARFALLQRTPDAIAKYRDAALKLATTRSLLAQFAHPDCRTGTLPLRADATSAAPSVTPAAVREIYAAWYLYLLTGSEPFLWQAMEGLGAFTQRLDPDTGQLRDADNNVHVFFPCMDDIALTTAFLVDRPNGTFVGWNCIVSQTERGDIMVKPAEKYVTRLHLNFASAHTLRIKFGAGTPATKTYPAGMSWTGPGGLPETIRAWGEDPNASSLNALR